LSEFAVLYQISSKLVHPFGFQTPILLNVQSAVARQRPLPWQPRFGGHVANVMGCDQPSFVPIGPLQSELWYFQYFPIWRPSATLNFKNFNISSCDCHCGRNMLLCTELHRNMVYAFSPQTPITAERSMRHWYEAAVAMATASWGHVGDMMGCDHPSCVPVGRLVGELWHFEYISNMAAVRHFEF